MTIAQASKEIFNDFMMFDFDFIGFGSISELFISGVRHHHHHVHHRLGLRRHHRHG